MPESIFQQDERLGHDSVRVLDLSSLNRLVFCTGGFFLTAEKKGSPLAQFGLDFVDTRGSSVIPRLRRLGNVNRECDSWSLSRNTSPTMEYMPR